MAGRLSKEGQVLFVDGLKVAEDPASTEAENITGFWRLGFGHISYWAPLNSGTNFQGTIDEVWIAHAYRSDDFIKLNFFNLKPGMQLVTTP